MASIPGYNVVQSAFSTSRGPQWLDPDTGSSYQAVVAYNVEIPTGSAERTYVQGNTSVQIIDPNGEGTCKPRLVATASFSFKIINDLNASAGAPFTGTAAADTDVTELLNFFGALGYDLPAATPLVGAP